MVEPFNVTSPPKYTAPYFPVFPATSIAFKAAAWRIRDS